MGLSADNNVVSTTKGRLHSQCILVEAATWEVVRAASLILLSLSMSREISPPLHLPRADNPDPQLIVRIVRFSSLISRRGAVMWARVSAGFHVFFL